MGGMAVAVDREKAAKTEMPMSYFGGKEIEMAFLNEYISPQNRERYQLEAFEKRLPSSNPQDAWAIDLDRDVFLRVIRPDARGSEPGDPDSRFEKDFHFRWKGYDYLVSTRRLDAQELQDWPGEIFESSRARDPNARVLRFYLRHIGEMGKPRPDAPSALRQRRNEVLSDLEDALGFGSGGTFIRLTPQEAAQPRYAIFKIAPRAEVAA